MTSISETREILANLKTILTDTLAVLDSTTAKGVCYSDVARCVACASWAGRCREGHINRAASDIACEKFKLKSGKETT